MKIGCLQFQSRPLRPASGRYREAQGGMDKGPHSNISRAGPSPDTPLVVLISRVP